ncbi:MAG: restriction endonuclease subunit S [Alcaligenaceae bacterium]|nr:restriction endonuclease subunit S [Alcaligenaceae bacterium]
MSFDFLLPENWQWSNLQEISAKGRSVVSGPFGSSIGKRFFVESGVPIIRGNNLSTGMEQFNDDGFVYLTPEKANEFKSHEALPDDLIFTAAGTIGQVGLIPKRPKFPKYIISNKQLRVRLDNTKMNPKYAYYWFASPAMVNTIKSRNTGSTIPLINLSVLRSLPVPVPPLKEQDAIAKFLSTLDDRITLLRETNKTLESIAQAIFKSWFVDFDPVRAKMEGRQPEGMDEDTAALFPDSFEETEMGEVPRGWRWGEISEIATFQNGYAFKSKDWTTDGYPVVKIGDVKPGIIDLSNCSFVSEDTVKGLTRFKLHRGDLLVGMTGYVGETGLVPASEPAPYLNQRVGRIAALEVANGIGYTYCAVRTPKFKEFAEAQSHGSAQANVSGASLMTYPIVVGSREVIHIFNTMVGALIENILSNHEYSETLSTLRDTLLPRLISGQLRLPEAQEQVEAALS